MVERADAVVVGAGVIGLAVARALALSGREVIVLERHDAIGVETSSRNSEVIHAGIYYKPSGMRGRLCVKGRDALYDYCIERGVTHQRCGKLIVASGEAEIGRLSSIKQNAERNGVDDLQMIDGAEARRMEPGLLCHAAIHSPSSGIVDSHELMLALLGDLEAAGGVLALRAPVHRGVVRDDGIDIQISGDDPITLRVKTLVNCGGLWADRIARSIDGIPLETIPALKYGKGQYFSYTGKAPFKRLIYPVPPADSQGVHYTRDLGGQAKLGPDLNYVSSNTDYDVDASRREAFAVAAKRFWPELDAERLVPGYAGIRPKIKGPGEEGDFVFSDVSVHGVKGYLGLYGIESPGLTTCLAIADHTARLV